MKVDFNNLRKQTIYAYNNLVISLNHHIDNLDIEIAVDEIEKDLDDLRSGLVALACCYEEGDPDNKCIIDDINGGIAVFNQDARESI